MSSRLVVNKIQDSANKQIDTTFVTNATAKGYILQRNNSAAFATLDSFNISATTDHANGDTTYTVTNAMSSANYLVFCTGGDDGVTDKHMMALAQSGGSQQSTTTFRTFSRDISANATGNIESHAQATFGDLA